MCTGTLWLILTVGSSDDVISGKKVQPVLQQPPKYCGWGGGGGKKSSSLQWPFLHSPLIPCFLQRKCGFGHFTPKFASMYLQNSPKPLSGWGGAAAFSPISRVPFSKGLCSSEETLEWDYSIQGTLLPQGRASTPFPARQIFTGAVGEALLAECHGSLCTLPMGARSGSVKTSFLRKSTPRSSHPSAAVQWITLETVKDWWAVLW